MNIQKVLSACFISLLASFPLASAKPYQSEPNMNGYCGSNTAYAITILTQSSIQKKVAAKLGFSDMSEVRAALQKRLEGYSVTLVVSIKPNGHLVGLSVLRSSGRTDIDAEAYSVIKNAAPFTPNKFPNELPYRVTLPECRVRPGWIAE